MAARGIDISGLPFVVNLTLPDNQEDYIHRVGRVGRADTLGLAVSLVSTVPERVWFCKRKGYTPWLSGPSAADVKEHTIWMDEPALLAAVETRLGGGIPLMGHDCALPASIAEAAAGTEDGAAYGKARKAGASDALAAARREQLAPAIAALSALEHRVQLSYWGLKLMFEPPSAGLANMSVTV